MNVVLCIYTQHNCLKEQNVFIVDAPKDDLQIFSSTYDAVIFFISISKKCSKAFSLTIRQHQDPFKEMFIFISLKSRRNSVEISL